MKKNSKCNCGQSVNGEEILERLNQVKEKFSEAAPEKEKEKKRPRHKSQDSEPDGPLYKFKILLRDATTEGQDDEEKSQAAEYTENNCETCPATHCPSNCRYLEVDDEDEIDNDDNEDCYDEYEDILGVPGLLRSDEIKAPTQIRIKKVNIRNVNIIGFDGKSEDIADVIRRAFE